MTTGDVVIAAGTLILYLAVTFLLYERARASPKRRMLLWGFVLLDVYYALWIIDNFTSVTTLDPLRHATKIVAYAMILGVFAYIAYRCKDPHGAAKWALAAAALTPIIVLAEHSLSGGQSHSLLELAAELALLGLAAACYMNSTQERVAKCFAGSGTCLVLLAFIQDQTPNVGIYGDIAAMVAGTILVAAGVYLHYTTLPAPQDNRPSPSAADTKSRRKRPSR